MTLNRSTLHFKPNLFPVKSDSIYSDADFLMVVEDPALLESFKKHGVGVHLAPWQKDEASYSIPCMFAPKGDLVFGTVSKDEGKIITCRCANVSCAEFRKCRPDFDESELEIMVGNEEAAASLDCFDGKAKRKLRHYSSDLLNKWAAHDENQDESLNAMPLSTGMDYLDEDPAGLHEDQACEATAPDDLSCTGDLVSNDSILIDELICASQDPSDDQRRIIEAPYYERLVVNAGPGRGKTYTLINRLKHLIEDQDVDPESILVLSYSRAAVSVIRKRLSQASKEGEITVAWQRLDLRTFDKFATWLLYLDADMNSDNDAERKRKTDSISPLNYDQRIRKAASVIRKWTGLFDETLHVLVDETQDLTDPRTVLVKEMLSALPSSSGFTLLGDSCQSLFDYTVKNRHGAGTFSQMLEEIDRTMAPTHYELEKNYRQPQGLPYDIDALRYAILSSDRNRMLEAARSIAESLDEPEVDFRRLDFHELARRGDDKTLGILTRTNGQALYVSNLLRGSNIDHVFRPSGFVPPMTRDIADIFTSVQGETIGRNEFMSLGLEFGIDGELLQDYWYGLIDFLPNAYGSRYEISSLLSSLATGSRKSTLFLDPGRESGIIVSTIHSAKGREFDEVWLLQEDLEAVEKPEVDLDEYKVAYVSLTRPRTMLKLQKLGAKIRIRRFHDEDANRKRCFKRGAGIHSSGSRVVNIEVLSDVDVDPASFGSDSVTQTIISDCLRIGDPLKLKLNRTSKRYFPSYDIVTDDEVQICIGATSDSFSKAFMKAFRKSKGARDLSDAEVFEQYPEGFDDIYVDAITTCISTEAEAPAGARVFGNMAIWHGISLTGFAKRNTQKF